MTREELLSVAKPILFNTEMVRAILDGRKTVTRRVVKQSIVDKFILSDSGELLGNFDAKDDAPYQPGDILYVRETWAPFTDYAPCVRILRTYAYRADDDKYFHGITMTVPVEGWHPSIHMPKDAARLFLRVTDVRAERLQDINIDEIRKEGLPSMAVHAGDIEIATAEWRMLWDGTIKKSDLAKYGWDANPRVWVIEFERVEVDK